MKRLLPATLGLLLAHLLIFGTTRADEKSLFPYDVPLRDRYLGSLMERGNEVTVWCDTNAGMLIYDFSYRWEKKEFAVGAGSHICQASGDKVTFPYKVRRGIVFCDTKANMLIYDFAGDGSSQYVIVSAPNVCHS